MVAGGKVPAKEKLRVLSDWSFDDELATWRGFGGSPNNNEDDGAVDDDEVAMPAAQIKKIRSSAENPNPWIAAVLGILMWNRSEILDEGNKVIPEGYLWGRGEAEMTRWRWSPFRLRNKLGD